MNAENVGKDLSRNAFTLKETEMELKLRTWTVGTEDVKWTEIERAIVLLWMPEMLRGIHSEIHFTLKENATELKLRTSTVRTEDEKLLNLREHLFCCGCLRCYEILVIKKYISHCRKMGWNWNQRHRDFQQKRGNAEMEWDETETRSIESLDRRCGTTGMEREFFLWTPDMVRNTH